MSGGWGKNSDESFFYQRPLKAGSKDINQKSEKNEYRVAQICMG